MKFKSLKLISVFFLFATIIFSCSTSDETIVTPGTDENTSTDNSSTDETLVEGEQLTSAVLGADYGDVIFFDLGFNKQFTVERNTWDLGFDDNKNVVLNGASQMFAITTKATTLAGFTTTDSSGFAATYGSFSTAISNIDHPNGDLNQTAIEAWSGDSSPVIVINRGVNPDKSPKGWVKMIITKTSSGYSISSANIDGSGSKTTEVSMNSEHNFSYANLDGKQATFEQTDKGNWDIAFTSYTEHLPAGPSIYAYGVTGVLLNPNNVMAAKLVEASGDKSYSAIDLAYAQSLTLTSERNVIGYDWKKYESGTFNIVEGVSFVVKDQDGNYFKLRLTNFYDNTTGEKGSVEIQYELLK